MNANLWIREPNQFYSACKNNHIECLVFFLCSFENNQSSIHFFINYYFIIIFDTLFMNFYFSKQMHVRIH